jgi:type II secretory pathway predicted ATPase ExeA
MKRMLDVYRTYYKLTGEPFRLSPDHRFSLGHRSYANAKAYLDYALLQGEGFIAITGGPGTGKTTLIGDILAGFEQTDMLVATLTSTQLESRDLLQMVAHSFDLHPEDRSKANLLLELERFLNQQSYRGHRTILIVDEAQSLSPSALEELRLLANMQRKDQLLLQIFLVGQEKLLDLIRAPGMEQLQQRLVAASVLEALRLDETIDYIEHRLRRVAWRGDPSITEAALRLVHQYSGGIPRRINMICNRLFLYGGMQQKHQLDGEDARIVVEELCQEFLLPAEPPAEAADAETDANQPADGAETPVRSLPRGEQTAEDVSTSTRQGASPPRAPGRNAENASPRYRSDQGEPPNRTAGRGRDAIPRRHAQDRPGRMAAGFDRQPGGTVASPAARRVAATEPAAGYRKSRHLAATVMLLLAASLLAVVLGTGTNLDRVLSAVGLGGSQDTFETLLKTGVHKAVKVFPGGEGEEPVALESQSGQSDEPEVAETEAPPDVSERGQAGGSDATAIASTPVTAAAEVEKPVPGASADTVTATATAAAPVTTDAEKENTIRAETKRPEEPDADVQPVSAPPVTPVNTATANARGESRNDHQADATAIEAEYGKLRQVASERFSQRQPQAGAKTVKVVPSPKTPTAPIVVDRSSVSVPVSRPKVSTATASTPRASVPKVSVPTSQPKITVATAAATPARGAKKGGLKRDKIRSALLEGQWTSQGKPASLLPSKITFCNSQGDQRIGCWSVAQNINTKYGPALYKVETTLKGFSAGSFKLSYRTLVKLVDAGASDGAKEKAASSTDGWQVTEHSMQCQLTQLDTVMCRDQKGVTRNYRRSAAKSSD